ncbi:PucR family transcriptional regulator [Nocardia sp. NPDC088792]|uniref:PucR family transcriptional regulator n=1 Tax=Nocardia sp. NPDC088792 TaxID=3364332 RepID=UPI003823A7BB
MSVSVGWVLTQPDLAVRLRGGAGGIHREIDLVVTTELENPYPWLSGGELVLTTGMRLPDDPARRGDYLRGLNDRGVAGVGFGVGLTHDELPADLVIAADEIGIPLFEVPLSTAFAAIVKQVSGRIAELQYDAVLRASRAQPRMTRALIKSGIQAIVRELAGSLGATALVLDPAGAVIGCQPTELDPGTLDRARRAVLADAVGAGVHTDPAGASITYQRINVGRRHHGDLVVVSAAPLGHIDQILLGHANSLLALDFEKPARLRAVQHRLNTQALSLLLGATTDLTPAWSQLAQAADVHGRIRVLVADCDTDAAVDPVRTALAAAIVGAGHPLFLHADERQLIAVLPAAPTTTRSEGSAADGSAANVAATDGSPTAAGSSKADGNSRTVGNIASAEQAAVGGAPAGWLSPEVFGGTRKLVRLGLSAAHPVRELTDAVTGARLAASAAERGGVPMEFGSLAGRSLLAVDATRDVLAAMARGVLAPLAEHDRTHGAELLPSLRAFLEANGHWESAAAATGIHRHTLRKRVTTAAGLLGADLDNARVRAELLLALLAHG